MNDHGAKWSASFVDAGIVTTSPETSLTSAKVILSNLSDKNPDLIIAELGDGVLGMYGVQNILADSTIRDQIGAFILCANDPVGAWGAEKYLKETFGITIDVVTGPTTDNDAGSNFITQTLGITAINARSKGKQLAEAIHSLLIAHPQFQYSESTTL